MLYSRIPVEVCKDRNTMEGVSFRSERRLMLSEVGDLHSHCSLENYKVTCDKQKKLLQRLREYAKDIRKSVLGGSSIALVGGCGTGKDHLLYSLAMVAWESGVGVKYVSGVKMFDQLRETFNGDRSRSDVADQYMDSDVLWLSDVVPPNTRLSNTDQSFLYRVIDERYRRRMPVWISMNASSYEDAEDRIGTAILDRFTQGGILCYCDWESKRPKV